MVWRYFVITIIVSFEKSSFPRIRVATFWRVPQNEPQREYAENIIFKDRNFVKDAF